MPLAGTRAWGGRFNDYLDSEGVQADAEKAIKPTSRATP